MKFCVRHIGLLLVVYVNVFTNGDIGQAGIAHIPTYFRDGRGDLSRHLSMTLPETEVSFMWSRYCHLTVYRGATTHIAGDIFIKAATGERRIKLKAEMLQGSGFIKLKSKHTYDTSIHEKDVKKKG